MKQADDTFTRELVPSGFRECSSTRYQGGKNGAGVYQTIINHIPRHAVYIEPFAGSAAVFRNKLPARNGSVLIERDPEQAERLRRELASPDVEVLQGSAFDLLPRLIPSPYDGPGVFVYLDPPYHPDTRRDPDLYRYELTADDHDALLDVVMAMSDRGVRFALSGYRCLLYDACACNQGWHRTDYQAMTRRGVVTESLWTNFDPAMVDLHDHRYLGEDFRERERIARKVRRWVGKLEKLPHHERGAIMAALANLAGSGDARSTRGTP